MKFIYLIARGSEILEMGNNFHLCNDEVIRGNIAMMMESWKLTCCLIPNNDLNISQFIATKGDLELSVKSVLQNMGTQGNKSVWEAALSSWLLKFTSPALQRTGDYHPSSRLPALGPSQQGQRWVLCVSCAS